jgi:hypothetical protein
MRRLQNIGGGWCRDLRILAEQIEWLLQTVICTWKQEIFLPIVE